MNLELINPFLAGAFNILGMVLGNTPERGELRLERNGATSSQVNIVIGVTGNVTGYLMIGMSLTTADAVASTMLGQQIKTFDALAASAIAELANMISGNGLARLSENGIVCDITPPTIIRGTKVSIDTLAIPSLVVPVFTTQGEISIIFMLNPVK